MSNQYSEIELFKDKNLSNIFEEIYTNHESKKQQICELISSLTPLVEGIGDATLLVPLIKEYMELGLKNDEQLVKLAQIVQRVETGKKGTSEGFNFSDLEGLLQEDASIGKEIVNAETNADKVINNVNTNNTKS